MTLSVLAELDQHAHGYCGDGATPKCFGRMRALIEEVTKACSLMHAKIEGCDCLPGEYDCVLHELLAIYDPVNDKTTTADVGAGRSVELR